MAVLVMCIRGFVVCCLRLVAGKSSIWKKITIGQLMSFQSMQGRRKSLMSGREFVLLFCYKKKKVKVNSLITKERKGLRLSPNPNPTHVSYINIISQSLSIVKKRIWKCCILWFLCSAWAWSFWILTTKISWSCRFWVWGRTIKEQWRIKYIPFSTQKKKRIKYKMNFI